MSEPTRDIDRLIRERAGRLTPQPEPEPRDRLASKPSPPPDFDQGPRGVPLPATQSMEEWIREGATTLRQLRHTT